MTILVLLLVGNINVISGQSFTARVDAKKIVQNSTVNVTFNVDGATGSNFRAPSFGELEVVAGPSQSSQTSIINGKMSQSISYTYTLLATRAGKYTIGPATISVKGKQLSSNPVSIEVVKGNAASSIDPSDKDTYVRLEVSTDQALIGEQITLDYKLYTQQDVQGVDILNESAYDGFFSQELHNYTSSVVREVIKGEEYYTKTVRRIALFPQRTGKFVIDPVTVSLAIPIPGARPTGFFGQKPTRVMRVQTNNIELTVTDPPEGAPKSFSGAIGKYVMLPSLLKKEITTDDAFVVNMEIRGTGDGKTFTAPRQPLLDGLEFYDPNILRDEDNAVEGVIRNYKQIEYLIVPKKPGNYILKPEFTYYDTDSNKYVTLVPKSFPVKVVQGSRKITNDNRETSISGVFAPDRNNVSNISKSSLNFGHPILWLSFIGLLGLIGYVSRTRYLAMQEASQDPVLKRKQQAILLANQKLEQAKSYMDKGERRKYFEAMSTAMNSYLSNKFSILNADFQDHRIATILSDEGLSKDNIQTYLSILKDCEIAIFAGSEAVVMQEVYDKAKALILSLEV